MPELADGIRRLVESGAQPVSAAEARSRAAMHALSSRRPAAVLVSAALVALALAIAALVSYSEFLGVVGNAHNTAAESDLGNAIIEARADYTADGGAFGNTYAGLSAELSAGETSFTYVDGSQLVKADNVVGVSAAMCGAHPSAALVSGRRTAGLRCQAVVLDSWRSSAPDVCYYVLVVKAALLAPMTLAAPLSVLGATVSRAGTYYGANAGMTGGCRLTTDVIHAHEWSRNGFPRPA